MNKLNSTNSQVVTNLLTLIYTFQRKALNMSFTILSKSKRSVYVLGGFKLSAKKVDTDIFEVFFRRKQL